MNTRTCTRIVSVIAVVATVGFANFAPSHLVAQSGTWNSDSAGNWSDTTKWAGGTVADGVDSTATFSNVITADRIVTLDSARTIGNITASDTSHNYTISGGNTLTLDATGTPIIGVTTSGRTLTISSEIAGSDGLKKSGTGQLTHNGSAVNTFTGGLNVNGGTLALNYANLATPTNLVNSSNALTFGGGTLTLTGKSTGTTNQTLGNVTVNSGGGQLLGTRNGGTALNIALGSLTATASGGSLLVGTILGGTSPVITTTTNVDTTGIYGGRVVFSSGTAATGYDWAANTGGGGPFTLSAYSGYSALDTTGGTDTLNSRITASATLTGSRTTNSLKFAPTAASQTLNIGASNTLTLTSGGLLITGTVASTKISGGNLTAGDGSGPADLIVHQFNTTNSSGGGIESNTLIDSAITNNGGFPVTLVKAGTGTLILKGANTFTGGLIVNGGTIGFRGTASAALNNNSITFNGNTTVLMSTDSVTSGGITINNGSVISFGNNTKTFTVNGPVTGEGAGINLIQDGGGATRLNFNSTANSFTGPIRYAVTAQDGTLTVNSLADSASLGEGNITFGLAGGATIPHQFVYGSGATAPLTLNNRQFELAGSTHGAPHIVNNSSQAFTINSDLVSSGTGTKNFTLRGTGTGLSTFAGDIGMGTITTLNLIKSESGTWVLSGDNSYNGTTTINASGGTLQLGDGGTGGSLSTSSAISVGTNGIFAVKQSDTVTQGIDFSGAAITGAGGFRQAGTGTTVLNAANTYSGTTTISDGTLQFANQESLYNNMPANWTAAKINVKSGATLALNVDSVGTAGFDSANLNTLLTNISVASNATSGLQSGATLGFDTSTATGGTFTQGNAIANSTGSDGGAIGVTKSGVGTLVFDKVNTYTGPTNVNAGTLLVNGTHSPAGVGAYTVANNATLGGNGSTSAVVNILSGGHLAPGNSIGALGTGPLNAAGFYDVELGTAGLNQGAPGFSDLTNVAGNLDLTGGTLSLFDNANANSQGSIGAGAYKIFDYSGSLAGSFGNNVSGPTGFVYRVDTATSNSVFLDVLDHADPNLSGPVGLTNNVPPDEFTFDFGTVTLGSMAQANLLLQNVATTLGFTAALDLDSVGEVDVDNKFATDLLTFSDLAAGSDQAFNLTFDTSALGTFTAIFSLMLSDEELPGADDFVLTLNATGTVVEPVPVPEPQTLVIWLLLGVGMVAWTIRQRKCWGTPAP